MESQTIRVAKENYFTITASNFHEYMPSPSMGDDKYFEPTIIDAHDETAPIYICDLFTNEKVKFECNKNLMVKGEEKLFTSIKSNLENLPHHVEHNCLQLHYSETGYKKFIIGENNLHTYETKGRENVWVKPLGLQFSMKIYDDDIERTKIALLYKKPSDQSLYKVDLTNIQDINNNTKGLDSALDTTFESNYIAYPSNECMDMVSKSKLTWVGVYMEMYTEGVGAIDIYNFKPILSDPRKRVTNSVGVLPRPHSLASRENIYSLVL